MVRKLKKLLLTSYNTEKDFLYVIIWLYVQQKYERMNITDLLKNVFRTYKTLVLAEKIISKQ